MSFVRALVFALVLSGTASAAHYLVADVADVIPAEQHAALQKAGVANTSIFYERAVTRSGREALAKSTGIALDQLSAWARFIDLMQVSGVGPSMVRVLNAAGVADLKTFQLSQGADLVPRMRAANAGNKYAQVLPNAEVVQAWIDAARRIKVRLEP